MQKYELMIIIESSLDETAAEEYFKDWNNRLKKDFGANVSFEDFWGARGFAYRIKKQPWGYYGVSQFEADSNKVAELRHELGLDLKIVRSLCIKVDPKAPAPRPYKDMKAEYEALEKEKMKKEEAPASIADKNTKSREKLTTIKEVPEEAPTPEKEKPKPVVKKEKTKKEENDDLDKKLGSIVDESVEDL